MLPSIRVVVVLLLGLTLVGCGTVMYTQEPPVPADERIIYTSQAPPRMMQAPPQPVPSQSVVGIPSAQPAPVPVQSQPVPVPVRGQPTPSSLVPQQDAAPAASRAQEKPVPIEQDDQEKHPSGFVSEVPDPS